MEECDTGYICNKVYIIVECDTVNYR